MTDIVEVEYTGTDWPDLVADMRSWLDRRQIEPDEFQHSMVGRGVTVRVGFGDGNHAAAFASTFSGRLERIADDRTADLVRGTIAQTAGEESTIFGDLTTSGEPLTASAPWAAKTGVSLMITRQQKADLRERGYTDEQIRDMKPEEAHKVLGLID